jgi:hypothetical protein
MTYTKEFLALSGGGSLTPLELRGNADLRIAERLYAQPERLRTWCANHQIRFGCDLHMTADAGCFQPAGAGDLILHEGKTFHQYADSWQSQPRHSVSSVGMRPLAAQATRYYRVAFRDIARSNDERTMIACIAPPGVVFGHTATVEKTPWARANADALVLCALLNSFPFDWLMRQKAATHLSLYILDAQPVPRFSDAARRFLAHVALRLSCSHAGFDRLWDEQLGSEPRRRVPQDHWLLRAQIDAVVADAYGLARAGYAHLLASFSHRSRSDAALLCLSAFDALLADGAVAAYQRHDPYWRLPLLEAPAMPAGHSGLVLVE